MKWHVNIETQTALITLKHVYLINVANRIQPKRSFQGNDARPRRCRIYRDPDNTISCVSLY